MKKILAILSAVVLLLSLCSCGNKNNTSSQAPGEVDSTTPIVADEDAIMADLDGDGVDEYITTETETDELGYESGWKLTVKNESTGTSSAFDNEGYLATANIIDLDSNDYYNEIVVTYDYASDDYATRVFRYKDSALISTSEIRGKYTSVSDGIITVYYNVDVLDSTWNAYTYYKLSEDSFDLVRCDKLWYIEATDFDYLTTKKDIAVTDEDGYVETLPAGTQILPVSSDLTSLVNIRTEDGTLYTINFDVSNSGTAIIDGTDVDEIVDDTQYAG